MFTKAFWKAAAERAVKTAAQPAVVLLGANAIDVLSVDWQNVASLSAGAAVLSVLTSIASDAVSSSDGPSLTDAEVLPSGGE